MACGARMLLILREGSPHHVAGCELTATNRQRYPRGVLATKSAIGYACLAIAFTTGLAGTATAQSRPSEEPPPNCLDQSITDELGQSLRPRGVQKREFLKKGQLELVARGGLYASDLLSSSYLGGGALAYYLTEDFGLELGVDLTPVDLDLDKPLARFFGDDRFEPGLGFLALASMLWSPIHAKLRIGESIVHSDVIFLAGGGRLLHESVQGFATHAGMAVEMYTNQWLSLRFDLRDVILVQEAVAETRLTNNLVASVGIALWIPTGL